MAARRGRLGARRRLRGAAAVVARVGRPRLVPRAARARPTRACRACRRTGCSTRATRGTRCAGSSRRSSARSRRPTCSSSCCCCSRRAGRRGSPSRRRSSATPGCSGRTRGPRTSRSRAGSSCSRLLTRRWWPVLAAAVSLAVGIAFVEAFPTIGPSTSYTPGGARVPPRAGRAEPGGERGPARGRRVLAREPLAQPARRDRDRPRPPAGLRARQRRRDREAHGRRDPGGRVDVHRARGRHRARRGAGLHRVVRRAAPRPAPRARSGRGLRRRARARAADRRDRRALAGLRGLRARRRGRRHGGRRIRRSGGSPLAAEEGCESPAMRRPRATSAPPTRRRAPSCVLALCDPSTGAARASTGLGLEAVQADVSWPPCCSPLSISNLLRSRDYNDRYLDVKKKVIEECTTWRKPK